MPREQTNYWTGNTLSSQGFHGCHILHWDEVQNGHKRRRVQNNS